MQPPPHPEQTGFGPDCYAEPGACGAAAWCQLADRSRWSASEKGTRGRCVPYARECHSCTPTAADSLPDTAGLNLGAMTPQGEFLDRPTRCGPGLVCTGDAVPSLPATCVLRRPRDRVAAPTRQELVAWCMRFVRMGGHRGAAATTTPYASTTPFVAMYSYGESRQDTLHSANALIAALWPAARLGPFPGPFVPGREDAAVPLCESHSYQQSLTDYQRAGGGCEYRAPVASIRQHAPPCLWTVNYSYNDEGPAVWSMIHSLVHNLPDDRPLADDEVGALRRLPMYLREHLSCPDCRGNVAKHLIALGVPTGRSKDEWARYWWRAHNVVNEHSAHTRCGHLGCGFEWAYPSEHCAGKYQQPWFMSYDDAVRSWTIPTASAHPAAATASQCTIL